LKLKQGQSDQACAAFNKAIKLHPEIVLGYVALAQTYMQQGKDEDALQPLLQARASLPQDATLEYYTGLLLMRVGRKAEGETALKNSIRLREQEPEPHYELGKYYAEQNQLEPARREFEQRQSSLSAKPHLLQAWREGQSSADGRRRKAPFANAAGCRTRHPESALQPVPGAGSQQLDPLRDEPLPSLRNADVMIRKLSMHACHHHLRHVARDALTLRHRTNLRAVERPRSGIRSTMAVNASLVVRPRFAIQRLVRIMAAHALQPCILCRTPAAALLQAVRLKPHQRHIIRVVARSRNICRGAMT
jgi:hypothetical protein